MIATFASTATFVLPSPTDEPPPAIPSPSLPPPMLPGEAQLLRDAFQIKLVCYGTLSDYPHSVRLEVVMLVAFLSFFLSFLAS